MKISVKDKDYNFTSSDALYEYIIRLLSDLKLTLGPEGLSATLRRHKKIFNWLIEYQSSELKIIEDNLDDFVKL